MNSIRKVLDYNYNGDIYKLHSNNSIYPMIATDMHPLWVIKNNNFLSATDEYIFMKNFSHTIQSIFLCTKIYFYSYNKQNY